MAYKCYNNSFKEGVGQNDPKIGLFNLFWRINTLLMLRKWGWKMVSKKQLEAEPSFRYALRI